jgi:hypothetical protein
MHYYIFKVFIYSLKNLKGVIYRKRGVFLVTSAELAKKLKLQHFSVIRLISLYKKELLLFGKLRKRTVKFGKGTKGGRSKKLYKLNDMQKFLLIMLSKNTYITVALKTKILMELKEINNDRNGDK